MPVASRAFVKASIVCLCIGAILGALLFANRLVPLGPGVAALRVSHIQLLIVGWLTQLILGVAWWLFPPLKTGLLRGDPGRVRRGQAQRGSEPLFWVTFFFLNAGVLLRSLFEPLYIWTQAPQFQMLAGLSGLLLLVAAAAFVANMWARVRALGSQRKAQR
jgi:hypothetical protein